MATVYFVRHAQPEFSWADDKTRPLTNEGIADSEKVCEALKDVKLTYAISSPYKRSRVQVLLIRFVQTAVGIIAGVQLMQMVLQLIARTTALSQKSNMARM